MEQSMASSNSDRPFPTVEGVEVTHRFLDVDGVKIHVAEAGAGELSHHRLDGRSLRRCVVARAASREL